MLIENNINGLKYFQLSTLNNEKFIHGFFSRIGGVSPQPYSSLNLGGTTGDESNNIVENRKRIFDCINRPVESIYDVWQVHGNEVIVTEKARPLGTQHIPADGIITHSSSVTLMMRFADCVPIILYDPVKHVAGIAHAGWQGTVKRVAQKIVFKMIETYGTKAGDILAGIGPSICPVHYFVGEPVISSVCEHLPAISDQVLISKNDKTILDLWKSNLFLLQEVGVKNIEISNVCTYSGVDNWFSYRKEGAKSGRFAVVVGLK